MAQGIREQVLVKVSLKGCRVLLSHTKKKLFVLVACEHSAEGDRFRNIKHQL